MNNNTTIFQYIAFRWLCLVPVSTKGFFSLLFINASFSNGRGIFYVLILMTGLRVYTYIGGCNVIAAL
ncbi:membrane protein [Rhodobacteraceae phage LS06-2018-MD05]|nr:membrane protein [Rhodobacteraceae phage LS06-2018-MD05]